MPDLENVIKGLECFTNVYPSGCKERNCSYLGKDCELAVMADALELLKKQEPMRVLSQRECETLPNHYERKGFCPKCHQTVEWLLNRSYCGFCGQGLKWE